MGGVGSGAKLGRDGTLQERFERKYIPEPNSGCWLWIGAVGGRDGRAMIGMDGKVAYAARVSWLLYKKMPLPEDIQVHHSCDMPACVNPDHLWLGSQLDNVRDCKRKGRLKPPPGPQPSQVPRGESHGQAKLTEADVREIRTGRLSNYKYARKFGVSVANVRFVKIGRSWKHLL